MAAIMVARTDASAVEVASEKSGPDWWTLGFGLIGALIVAILTHFFTRRRERDKWLRELQVKANQEFYNALDAIVAFISHGPSGKALHFGEEENLLELRDQLDDLIVALGNAWSAIAVVAEPRTRKITDTIMDVVPVIARLAVPLPGAVNRASKNRTDVARDNLLGLAAHLLLVMRDDMGLIPWWRWKMRKEIYRDKKTLKRAQVISKPLVDLTHEEEPGGPPSPFEALEWLQVKPLRSSVVPADVEGYRADNNPYRVSVGKNVLDFPAPESQGMLIKAELGPWQFALATEVPADVENQIMKDAARIVDGNGRIFAPQLRTAHEPTIGVDVWLWNNVPTQKQPEFRARSYIGTSNQPPTPYARTILL